MKTIATINFKGGVGKTTVTWCLGDVLSIRPDSTVLLFDLDAQSSLTQSIELNEGEAFKNWKKGSVETGQTIHDVLQRYLDGGKFDFQPDNTFIYRMKEKYHFIPSTDELYWMELELNYPEKTRTFIRRLLEKIEHSSDFPKYDYAIFDCPPSFTLLSYSVLACCDLVLIPITPDFFAAKGIDLLARGLAKIGPRPFPKIAVFANRVWARKRGHTGPWPRIIDSFYMDRVKDICESARQQLRLDIRFLDAWLPNRVAIEKAITNRQTPPGLLKHFRDLWKEIEVFTK